MPFYVTTPIYYVNAAPHLGHAYTTIAADVMARHHRQRGEEVFFLTGTDEHGEPVADAAHALGIDPQELADRNAERFKALAPQLEVTNDFFIRTTDPQHEAKVQEVLSRVRENGYVYEGTYEGWYCPRCADFKAENEIDEGNLCPIHHIHLTREQEDNYFFRLSAFQEKLERLYAEREDFVAPRTRYNEALSFIRSGLRDVPLTRHKLTWGVPVPWDPEHVFYVWFDALLNYYSALSYAREGEDLTERLWPANYHLIAKDILRFHTVYWPALLMAAEIELPGARLRARLPADGRREDEQVAGQRARPVRRHRPLRGGRAALLPAARGALRPGRLGLDGLLRAALRERAGQRARQPRQPNDRHARALPRRRRARRRARPGACRGLRGTARAAWRRTSTRAELTLALDEIWQRVRRLNRYVEEQAPWRLAKEPERAEELDRVLRTLVEGLRAVTVLLWPYLPASAERLLAALGAPELSLARRRAGDRARRARQRDRLAVPQGAADRPSSRDRLTHPSRPMRARRTPSSWPLP